MVPFLLFLIIIIFIALSVVIPIYKNHKKTTNGIINYNSTMSKFVFKVNMSKDDIISKLTTKNNADELSCTFDSDRDVVKFSEFGSNREYYIYVHKYQCFSVLVLEQVALLGMQSNVPYKLNPFIVKKLQAEIIPYSQCEF